MSPVQFAQKRSFVSHTLALTPLIASSTVYLNYERCMKNLLRFGWGKLLYSAF